MDGGNDEPAAGSATLSGAGAAPGVDGAGSGAGSEAGSGGSGFFGVWSAGGSLVVGAGLVVYLFYAFLHPEKL
jgi:K+-transporting ATPase KdpF subunit